MGGVVHIVSADADGGCFSITPMDAPNGYAKLTSAERVWLPLLLVGAGVGLYAGWRLFWFLTDDAYIAFRYVSNSMLGHGYVWNPPPFRPVEGYTSFLWVVLMDGIWRVLGVEPPVSANWVALFFSGLTLLLGAAMVLQCRWHERLRPYRVGFLALILLGVLTNRTFLAWTSSALETAMFNFFTTLWLYGVIFLRPATRARWVLVASFSAAAIALTRPDGYLFMAATAFMLGLVLLKNSGRLLRRWYLAALPLVLPVVHLIWRRSRYGEWLPNTYFAKHTSWWPESGWRYAASFALEYGLGFWLAVVGAIAVRHAWPRSWRWCRDLRHADRRRRTQEAFNLGLRLTPLLTLAAYFLFYTVLIGGDHFEYRVYSFLILPIFVALAWAMNLAAWRPAAAMATMLAFLLLSWPVPWTHWALARHLTGGEREGIVGPVHIQQAFPAGLRPYARAFDRLQDWLLDHYVCVRYHGHRWVWEQYAASCPSREEGMRMAAAGYPVLKTDMAGILAWALPKANIIDCHGLNDYVIARSPHPPYLKRWMAHERYPPDGYVENFAPNVKFVRNEIIVTPRRKPITANDITAIENQWAKQVGKSNQAMPSSH